MPLPVPNLDDRDYAELLGDARRLVPIHSPAWTDLSAGDPGEVLLELFAYLTDTLLYRLNRVPEKAYVTFLNLLGVQLEPPTAATASLRFTDTKKTAGQTVPRGTRVTVGAGRSGADNPVFITADHLVLGPDGTGEVLALHCEQIEGEEVGRGTGLPGLSVRVARPPIIHGTADGLDLIVAVEATHAELEERGPALQVGDKGFRIWREVPAFGPVGPDPYVYVADRAAGIITFAPEVQSVTDDGLAEFAKALGAVPAPRAQILVSYRHGGGGAGNVAARTLTTIKDSLPGLQVTNPAPATGGRDAESLANALVRGPQQLHSLERAVTARDFELAALRSSGAVARAKAFTRATLWAHAVPGTTEVLLVPAAPTPQAAVGINAAAMEALQTPDALAAVAADLDSRRPMGTRCEVSWARYKTVRVDARVVVHRAEDVEAVEARMVNRLRRTVNPLPTQDTPAWRFGEALRASNVYDALLEEGGVRYVESVRLLVDEVPEDVRTIDADPTQPHTWYCGSGPLVFRSLDDGDGWEPSGRFPGERVELVRTSRHCPGLVVAASRVGSEERSRLRVSFDCGETWKDAAEFEFHVEDFTIVERDGELIVLLATDRGLYELGLHEGAVPVQVLVDATRQDLGFYAVAAITSDQGDLNVAVAAQELGGVLISALGGRPGTFRPLGAMQGKDIRVLVVREEGPGRFLIAGAAAPTGAEAGDGAYIVEIVGTQIGSEGWQPLARGWEAGSCHGLAVQGGTLLAASHRMGVLRLDLEAPLPAWTPPEVDSGLALRDRGRFAPLTAVAVSPDGSLVMAGGPVTEGVPAGVRRSTDGGESYESVCEREFPERVTLPDTWLFCSGDHTVKVVTTDAQS